MPSEGMQNTGGARSVVLNEAVQPSAISGGTVRQPSFKWSDIWKSPLHDLPLRDEILYQYLPLGPQMEILEVGPGSGYTAFRMSRRVKRMTLLDIAPGTIEKLRRSLGALSNLNFVCANPGDPEFHGTADGAYDAAFGLDVFQHVPEAGKWLDHLASMLKPGGTLFLTWPNYCPSRSLGVNYIPTVAELDNFMCHAGFESWEVYTLRLRPYAGLLYRSLHERPRKFYQKVRGHREALNAQEYDQTWTYQHGRSLEPIKYALHAAWTLFFAGVRLGGDCFGRTPVTGDDATGNLLLLARTPLNAASSSSRVHEWTAAAMQRSPIS